MSAAANGFDASYLRELVACLESSWVDTVEIEGPAGRLRLVVHGCQAAPPATVSMATPPAEPAGPAPDPTSPPATQVVRAPFPGSFLPIHPHAAASPFQVGDPVPEGACLGFIQTGAMVLPIRPPSGGPLATVLAGVLAADGAAVEYGTPLFELLPSSTTISPAREPT